MRVSHIIFAAIGISSSTHAAFSGLLFAREDANVVTTVLKNVTSKVENLTAVAKTGDAKPGILLKASDAIVQAIESGTVAVQASPNLTFIETVHLIGPVHQMSKLSSDLTSNMVKLRASIEKQSLCVVVRLQIGNINDGAGKLIKAVNSKVPAAALDISQALSQGITDTLNQIQVDFSEKNCVDGRIEQATSSGPRVIGSVSSLFVLVLVVAIVSVLL